MPIALVTGGSRGIGAAAARLAAARGYAVALCYRSAGEAAARVVDEIERAGGRALALRADVSREEEVVELFARLDRELGRLDALVNNAGVLEPQTRLEGIDAHRLARVLGVNVIGSFLCAREAVKRMSTLHGGKGGAIVNLSSAAARLGSPFEFIDYAASKGAIDTFTVGLAREVAGEGIRVNAVRPGLIDTDMQAASGEPGRLARLAPSVPMGRGGSADEIARAILYLLSPEAGYVTGAILDVTGGR